MPGNGDFDFTIGTVHKQYGRVLSIEETEQVLTYEGSNASQFNVVIKITFEKQEIVLQRNNPLVVVYRKEVEQVKMDAPVLQSPYTPVDDEEFPF